MRKLSKRFSRARVRLSPLFFCLLILVLGVLTVSVKAKNRSLTIAPGMAIEDAFPKVRERAVHTLKTKQDGFTIKVHYAEGEKAVAQEAAQAMKRPIVFLQEITGLSPGGKVDAYVYPLAHEELAPHVLPRGPGIFTMVFFVRPDLPLTEVVDNQVAYLETYTHELSHRFVHELPLEDRWLDDGLAEYLSQEFVEATTGAYPGPLKRTVIRHDWNPALVALERVNWEKWGYKDIKWVIRRHEKDVAKAAQVGQEELWKYSAAAELLNRWMAAARHAGVERPVHDLMHRLRDYRGKVRWEDTQELIQSQTGKTLEELVRVSPEDLQKAREWAWQEHLSPYLGVRTRALRTITFLGLLEGATPASLLDAYELPEVRLRGPYVAHNLAISVSQAIGRAGDPEVAATAIAELRERFETEDIPLVSVPSLWVSLAETGEREEALSGLVALLQDPRQGLEQKRQANAGLEELTGTSAGWATDHPPERRAEAARRWTKILETLDHSPTAR